MSDEQKLLELVASRREAVLATIRRDGRPQLSNIMYTWDPGERIARISTTAKRAKARNLMRDPRATLYVPGGHFWAFAVADGDAEICGPTKTPGDEAGRELLQVHSSFYGGLEPEAFFQEMVENERLVIRLRISHLYGLVMDKPQAREPLRLPRS
jgi:PPOX class probable F420-dependent enzyme